MTALKGKGCSRKANRKNDYLFLFHTPISTGIFPLSIWLKNKNKIKTQKVAGEE